MSFQHQQDTRNNYVFEGFNATQKVKQIANETKKICMKSGKNEKNGWICWGLPGNHPGKVCSFN